MNPVSTTFAVAVKAGELIVWPLELVLAVIDTDPMAVLLRATVVETCPFDPDTLLAGVNDVTALAGEALHVTVCPATVLPLASRTVATSGWAKVCPGFAL